MEIFWLFVIVTWLPAGWYGGRAMLKGWYAVIGQLSWFPINYALVALVFGWVGFIMGALCEPGAFLRGRPFMKHNEFKQYPIPKWVRVGWLIKQEAR